MGLNISLTFRGSDISCVTQDPDQKFSDKQKASIERKCIAIAQEIIKPEVIDTQIITFTFHEGERSTTISLNGEECRLANDRLSTSLRRVSKKTFSILSKPSVARKRIPRTRHRRHMSLRDTFGLVAKHVSNSILYQKARKATRTAVRDFVKEREISTRIELQRLYCNEQDTILETVRGVTPEGLADEQLSRIVSNEMRKEINALLPKDKPFSNKEFRQLDALRLICKANGARDNQQDFETVMQKLLENYSPLDIPPKWLHRYIKVQPSTEGVLLSTYRQLLQEVSLKLDELDPNSEESGSYACRYLELTIFIPQQFQHLEDIAAHCQRGEEVKNSILRGNFYTENYVRDKYIDFGSEWQLRYLSSTASGAGSQEIHDYLCGKKPISDLMNALLPSVPHHLREIFKAQCTDEVMSHHFFPALEKIANKEYNLSEIQLTALRQARTEQTIQRAQEEGQTLDYPHYYHDIIFGNDVIARTKEQRRKDRSGLTPTHQANMLIISQAVSKKNTGQQIEKDLLWQTLYDLARDPSFRKILPTLDDTNPIGELPAFISRRIWPTHVSPFFCLSEAKKLCREYIRKFKPDPKTSPVNVADFDFISSFQPSIAALGKLENWLEIYSTHPGSLTPQDRLTLSEIGQVNSLASLAPKPPYRGKTILTRLESLGLLEDKPTFDGLKALSEEAQAVLKTVDALTAASCSDHFHDGDIFSFNGKKKAQWAGHRLAPIDHLTQLISPYSAIHEGILIGLSHDNKKLRKQVYTSEVFQAYDQKKLDTFVVCISDFWRPDPCLLVKPTMSEMLTDLYDGDEWKRVVSSAFNKQQRAVHADEDRTKAFHDLDIINPEERRIAAGLSKMHSLVNIVSRQKIKGPKIDPRKADRDFRKVHDNLYGIDGKSLSDEMFCSEFVAKSIIGTSVATNDVLYDKVLPLLRRHERYQHLLGDNVLIDLREKLEARQLVIEEDIEKYLLGENTNSITEKKVRKLLLSEGYDHRDVDKIIGLCCKEFLTIPFSKRERLKAHYTGKNLKKFAGSGFVTKIPVPPFLQLLVNIPESRRQRSEPVFRRLAQTYTQLNANLEISSVISDAIQEYSSTQEFDPVAFYLEQKPLILSRVRRIRGIEVYTDADLMPAVEFHLRNEINQRQELPPEQYQNLLMQQVFGYAQSHPNDLDNLKQLLLIPALDMPFDQLANIPITDENKQLQIEIWTHFFNELYDAENLRHRRATPSTLFILEMQHQYRTQYQQALAKIPSPLLPVQQDRDEFFEQHVIPAIDDAIDAFTDDVIEYLSNKYTLDEIKELVIEQLPEDLLEDELWGSIAFHVLLDETKIISNFFQRLEDRAVNDPFYPLSQRQIEALRQYRHECRNTPNPIKKSYDIIFHDDIIAEVRDSGQDYHGISSQLMADMMAIEKMTCKAEDRQRLSDDDQTILLQAINHFLDNCEGEKTLNGLRALLSEEGPPVPHGIDEETILLCIQLVQHPEYREILQGLKQKLIDIDTYSPLLEQLSNPDYAGPISVAEMSNLRRLLAIVTDYSRNIKPLLRNKILQKFPGVAQHKSKVKKALVLFEDDLVQQRLIESIFARADTDPNDLENIRNLSIFSPLHVPLERPASITDNKELLMAQWERIRDTLQEHDRTLYQQALSVLSRYLFGIDTTSDEFLSGPVDVAIHAFIDDIHDDLLLIKYLHFKWDSDAIFDGIIAHLPEEILSQLPEGRLSRLILDKDRCEEAFFQVLEEHARTTQFRRVSDSQIRALRTFREKCKQDPESATQPLHEIIYPQSLINSLRTTEGLYHYIPYKLHGAMMFLEKVRMNILEGNPISDGVQENLLAVMQSLSEMPRQESSALATSLKKNLQADVPFMPYGLGPEVGNLCLHLLEEPKYQKFFKETLPAMVDQIDRKIEKILDLLNQQHTDDGSAKTPRSLQKRLRENIRIYDTFIHPIRTIDDTLFSNIAAFQQIRELRELSYQLLHPRTM